MKTPARCGGRKSDFSCKKAEGEWQIGYSPFFMDKNNGLKLVFLVKLLYTGYIELIDKETSYESEFFFCRRDLS